MKIDELIKEAYKAHDTVSLNAYKNIKAELQQVLTAKNAPEYSDSLFDYTVAKYGRKLDKMIFEVGKDTNLGKEYSSELEVVKKLLPEPIDEDDIEDYLYDWCWECCKIWVHEEEDTVWQPEYSKKEMGMIIKAMKEKFPTADGKMISNVVKKYVV